MVQYEYVVIIGVDGAGAFFRDPNTDRSSKMVRSPTMF